MTDLTPAASKAARALLGWSMADLAKAAAVSLPTIQRVEGGKAFYVSTGVKLIETFAAHGVEVYPAPRDGARRTPRA